MRDPFPSVALALFCVFAAPLAACGDDTTSAATDGGASGPATSLFVVPSSLDALTDKAFFDHPFPSDLRKDAKGRVVFKGFPNAPQLPILTQYIRAADGLLDGFSPAAATALRFTAPIDTSALPTDPTEASLADSAVQIIDVDPASKEHGQRHLAQVHWQEEEQIYWPSNTLAVLPMLGRPLRAKTKYAVVVTSKVRSKNGDAVTAAPELRQVLDQAPLTDAVRAVHDLYAPAVAEVVALGIAKANIVHLAVFTTNDPTAETFAAMDDVLANVAAPTARDYAKKETASAYFTIEGNYGPSPNYQAGTAPYAQPADGGSFVTVNGKPQVQNMFDLRFALTIPNAAACPMPTAGYPIVLYAHGTGGDYRSFIDDGTGTALAQKCLATMGIDQIFHGTRPGAPALGDPNAETTIELLFFNLSNILSARTSNRQSAVDVVQQARLFTTNQLKVPAAVAGTTSDVLFDASKLTFFGHSQGSLNGPLFLAGTTQARGAVLSGAGSDLALNLLEKKLPIDVAGSFRLLTGTTDTMELSLFHPVMTLVQSLVDVADPLEYGATIARTPRAGGTLKSIYQTEGVNADGSGDSYAPPHGIESLAIAMGLPRQSPGIHTILEAPFAGLGDVTVPADGLSGNLDNGNATGILAQFVPTPGSDGHFVVFDNRQARSQAAGFLANLAADPKGRIPASQ